MLFDQNLFRLVSTHCCPKSTQFSW